MEGANLKQGLLLISLLTAFLTLGFGGKSYAIKIKLPRSYTFLTGFTRTF